MQRINNKMYYREKKPIKIHDKLFLHRAEIHIIEAIGRHPGINVTSLANQIGITKGAVSQTLKKIHQKNLITKNKDIGNDKEILLNLTEDGKKVFMGHERTHLEINKKFKDIFGILEKDKFDFLINVLRKIENYLT
jgi:DNA-binding MarR family transcriptional regulator